MSTSGAGGGGPFKATRRRLSILMPMFGPERSWTDGGNTMVQPGTGGRSSIVEQTDASAVDPAVTRSAEENGGFVWSLAYLGFG